MFNATATDGAQHSGSIRRPTAHTHREIPEPRLDLPEPVRNALEAAAAEVLKAGASYREASDGFQKLLVFAAAKQSDGNVQRVASKLRMNYGWAWTVLNGNAFKGKHR